MATALISMITSLIVAGMIKPITDYFMWKKAKKIEVLTAFLNIINESLQNLSSIVEEKHNKNLPELEFEIKKTVNFQPIDRQYILVDLYVSKHLSDQIKNIKTELWRFYGRRTKFGQQNIDQMIDEQLLELQHLIKNELTINTGKIVLTWFRRLWTKFVPLFIAVMKRPFLALKR